jgi:chemotaxis protein methyltransferase CheR
MDAAAVARHAQAPIIFSRNVFIYFSDDSIRRAVKAVDAAMPPTANLCVGASESLLRLATGFELQEIGGAFIYVKGGANRPQGSFAVATRAEGTS